MNPPALGTDGAITLSQATEADLEALMRIQFAAFAPYAHQRVGGPDTPANRAVAAARHAADLRDNSGLVIIKAELGSGGGGDDSGAAAVGFCMFYFPNEDAASAAERVPTPLRPWPAASEEPVLPAAEDSVANNPGPEAGGGGGVGDRDDETGGEGGSGSAAGVDAKVADAMARFIRQEKRKHVRDRECAYVRYMCVDPAHQRRGVGKALMAWACARLDDLGVDGYLEASAVGEGLYRQFGFELIGSSEADFGGDLQIDFTHMWRTARQHDKPS